MLLLSALLGNQASIAAEPFSKPFRLRSEAAEHQDIGAFRELGSVRLGTRSHDGAPIRELSGLAWDADEGLLYAVSDAGYLVHLRPRFGADRLLAVALVARFPLRDRRGAPLEGRAADAESLAVRHTRNGRRGDAELCVTFEIQPRAACFSTRGEWLKKLALPVGLRHRWNYRGANQQLESLAFLASGGFLTAPERPLKNLDPELLWLHHSDGRRWSFTPYDRAHSAVVGLETLHDDTVLVLERRFVSPLHAIVFTLRALHLDDSAGGEARTRELARLDNRRGWAIDNFEAIAHHEAKRFFIVSDDNQNPLQRSLLVYFELDNL